MRLLPCLRRWWRCWWVALLLIVFGLQVVGDGAAIMASSTIRGFACVAIGLLWLSLGVIAMPKNGDK